jgi:hypothetical protein
MTDEKDGRTPSGQDPGESSPFVNVMKWIFLVAVLVGAWFLLDRLINGN